MKYDPIMCMNVPDSVKTKDRDPYAYEEIKKDIQMMKSGKATYITKNELIGRISHSFNNRTPQSGGITKEQKTELMNLVMSSKDERTIKQEADRLIKKYNLDECTESMKDANKNEGFKIHKAEIRGDKLYLTYTDLLYGGKETESFTKSEAKGFLTDPWNTWEGNTKSVMMKFVKDSKTIDKAIRNCDRDPYEYETIKNDIDIAARGKASYITKSSLQSRITRGFQTNRLTKEQKEELWRLAESVKQ